MSSPFDFDWLEQHARLVPQAPFLGSPGTGWLDYRTVHERVLSLSALLSSAGVVPGSRVVSSLPLVPAAAIAMLAVHRLGAVAVELDRERSEAAIAAVLAQTRPVLAVVAGRDVRKFSGLERLVVCHPTRDERLAAVLGARRAGWLGENGDCTPASSVPSPHRDAKALAQLVFTSGSTAAPRGVMLSHENLASNTDGVVASLGLDARARAMLVLPLFYVYGKSVLLSHLRVGGSVWLDDRFLYPRVVLEELCHQRCTHFAGVPLTYQLLERLPGALEGLDLSSLKVLTQAGGAMSASTTRWVRQAFAPAKLFVMYGQTEATARLSVLAPEDAERKAGSIGRPIPGVTMKVVDDEGREVPDGTVGHLVAASGGVMAGYLDAPDETRAVLKDGWLWTGDLAHRDADGFFFITGRAKEMLKLGGHRVAPAELEEALCSHPAVAEAAVVGERDEHGVEAAVAHVVVRAPVEPQELLKHCRARLSAALVPRRIVFADGLPRTATGKLARHLLKEKERT